MIRAEQSAFCSRTFSDSGAKTVIPTGLRPRDISSALWINTDTDPCGTGGTVGIIDNPDADGDGFGDIVFGEPQPCDAPLVPPQTPCEGSWNVWTGDIPADSVIDCIVFAYANCAPDNDDDLDSIGDGIEGYDLILSFHDNDNGGAADGPGASGRSCILELTISDIPGRVGPQGAFVPVYTVVLDFADTAPSLIFELGDSDGFDSAGTGLSGGAIYGHPTFADRDGDGLHDFSFAMRFDQSSLPAPGIGPGMTKGLNGFLTVAPNGCDASPCPAPTDPPGVTDGTAIYVSGPSCPPDLTEYIDTYNFGGYDCATGAPHSSAYLELYGGGGIPNECECDIAPPFLSLDFSDVVAFLAAFQTCDPVADYAAPFGTCDFSDVIVFLTCFKVNCVLP